MDSEGIERGNTYVKKDTQQQKVSMSLMFRGKEIFKPLNTGRIDENLKDGQIFNIDGIKIECILVPGHTWGHLVYLIDYEYLFTGGTL